MINLDKLLNTNNIQDVWRYYKNYPQLINTASGVYMSRIYYPDENSYVTGVSLHIDYFLLLDNRTGSFNYKLQSVSLKRLFENRCFQMMISALFTGKY